MFNRHNLKLSALIGHVANALPMAYWAGESYAISLLSVYLSSMPHTAAQFTG